MRLAPILAGAALVVTSCTSGVDDEPRAASSTTTSVAPMYTSDVYGEHDAWLCRPDVEDACEADLDATVIEADGATRVERFEPSTDPAVDCFYVYPTVSNDPEHNSDLEPGTEEESVVVQQAARLSEVCALYAPMYRQATLTALRTGGFFAARGEAYVDVLDAWRHYLANDNDGRGVILLGHSQGAMHLDQLLEEEIDPSAEQRQLLVSVMLLGTSVHASDFSHLAPCAAIGEVGCVVSYSSFRDPPTAASFFGRPGDGGEPAVCTNPAALGGGPGQLRPYFSSSAWEGDVDTPFVALAGVVEAECVVTDDASVLLVGGPGAADLRGDLGPRWGLHLIDVNVAMGNLVELARAQAAAYSSAG